MTLFIHSRPPKSRTKRGENRTLQGADRQWPLTSVPSTPAAGISVRGSISLKETAAFRPRSFIKKPGADIGDVFMANIERVKEALRVLEECCKIIDEKMSRGYRKLRFDAYETEKKIIKKTRFISCNR